jgi:hypothetical protein
MKNKIEKTLKALRANHMAGYFVENPAAVLELIQTLVLPGSRVGCGDSITMEQTGVLDFLRSGEFVFL